MSDVPESSDGMGSGAGEQFDDIPAIAPLPEQTQTDQQLVPYTGGDDTDVPVTVSVSSPPSQPASDFDEDDYVPTQSEKKKQKTGKAKRDVPDRSMPMPLQSVSMQQSDLSPASTAQPPIGDSSASPAKRPRGRPRGSSNKKKQTEAKGSSGSELTLHEITVKVGEDVLKKVLAFFENVPRNVCIISAYGYISEVALCAATKDGALTHQGRFTITSLTGSLMPPHAAGYESLNGYINAVFSGLDGKVFGGRVVDSLVAASQILVLAGSYSADGKKDPEPVEMEPLCAPPRVNMGGAGTSSSPSRGTFSESSGGPASQGSGACNNPQGSSSLPSK